MRRLGVFPEPEKVPVSSSCVRCPQTLAGLNPFRSNQSEVGKDIPSLLGSESGIGSPVAVTRVLIKAGETEKNMEMLCA